MQPGNNLLPKLSGKVSLFLASFFKSEQITCMWLCHSVLCSATCSTSTDIRMCLIFVITSIGFYLCWNVYVRHTVLLLDNFRAREVMNTLVAIAIQAYAELNRWLEVVPFVSQTYNGLEDCPPLIAKLWLVFFLVMVSKRFVCDFCYWSVLWLLTLLDHSGAIY